MCMEFTLKCQCGRRQASFHFQDNIMPPEVVSRLFCPDCKRDSGFNASSSVEDNGWALEYDMSVAGFAAANLPSNIRDSLSPGTLFDQGCHMEGHISWGPYRQRGGT